MYTPVRLMLGLVLPLLALAAPAHAKCLDGACDDRCQSPSRPCVLWMTGAGSALSKPADIRARIASLEVQTAGDADIVVFTPSLPTGYTPEDIQEIQTFLLKRKVLGTNLHFLVSSAAAGPFETHIYSDLYLPSAIGAVLIAQPFSPGASRPIKLTEKVRPTVYAVYDVQMPDFIRRSVAAGPSLFEDPSVKPWHIVLWKVDAKNFLESIGQVLCLHTNTVGFSEDLSEAVLRKIVLDKDVDGAIDLLQRQEALRGGFKPDPQVDCGGAEPTYEEILGAYTGEITDTWDNCEDPTFDDSYAFSVALNMFRQSNGNFNGEATVNAVVKGLSAHGEEVIGGVFMPNDSEHGGEVQGTIREKFFLEGELDSEAKADFIGEINGRRLDMQVLNGQDIVGDTCSFAGRTQLRR
jgi:hypothetical protein